MRYLLTITIISVMGWCSTCRIVVSDIQGKDTTAVVSYGNGKVLTGINNDQLRDLLNTQDSLHEKLDTARATIDLMNTRIAKADSAYTIMTSVDSLMQDQVDTLNKVIALSEEIKDNLYEVRRLNDQKLKRCEESKMTFMEKIYSSVTLVFIGVLIGGLTF